MIHGIISKPFQIDQEALERARGIMRSMKTIVRIFVIQMILTDLRVILVTALQEDMQKGMLEQLDVQQNKTQKSCNPWVL